MISTTNVDEIFLLKGLEFPVTLSVRGKKDNWVYKNYLQVKIVRIVRKRDH